MADAALAPDETEEPIKAAGLGPDETEEPIASSRGLGGPTAAFRKPLPGAVRALEDYVLPGTLGTAGAAAGGAVGNLPGAMAGAGAGQVAADVISAGINKTFFGRDVDFHSLPSKEAANFAIGAATEAIPIGKLASSALGGSALAGGAKEAAQTATQSAERFGEKAGSIAQGMDQDIAAGKQQVAQNLAPEARAQTVTQTLQRTPRAAAQARALPAQKVAGAALPGEEAIDRQQAFHDAFFNPIHRASKALGEQYEKLFAGVRSEKIPDVSPLQFSLERIGEQEKQSLGPTTSPGPGVSKLLRFLSSMTTPAKKEAIAAEFSPEALATLPADQREYFAAMAPDLQKELGAEVEGENKSIPMTVQRLLQARAAGTALTRSSIPSRDKSLAFQAIDAIDSQLEHSGLVDTDALQGVNRVYGSYRKTFDQNLRRKIAQEFEPTDVAGEIFQSPQRFDQLWKGAEPAERDTLRETYGDWLLKKGINKASSVIEDEDQQIVLSKLYAGTPLADRKNWIHLDDKLVSAENIVNTSPEMKQAYNTGVQGRIQEAQTKAAQDAVDWAQKEGPKLGPYGEAMAKKARMAKTPFEGANEVLDFFKRHPEEAPIKALQAGTMEFKGNAFTQRAKRGLQWYPEILVATSLMGHPSAFAMAGIAMGGVAGVHVGMRAALRAGLKNPAAAKLFWEAVNKTGTGGSIRQLGHLAGDAMLNEAAAAIERKAGTAATSGEGQPQP